MPEEKPFSHVTIVGCGDIGRRVARLWLEKGLPVTGTHRCTEAQESEADGIQPACLDLASNKPEFDAGLAGTLLYYFVPTSAQGESDQHMRHFLTLLENQLPARFVLLSTSGVYGDCGGARVTEETPPNPQTARARRRLDAETQLVRFATERLMDYVILRVGGIYSKERLPLRRIQEQTPLLQENLAPMTNRIHADDLASACFLAASRGVPGRIYNISDGQDSNMTEYFNLIADNRGLPRPPTGDWELIRKTNSQGMLSYLSESRRMDNQRMREELGVILRFPDLKSALQDPDFWR